MEGRVHTLEIRKKGEGASTGGEMEERDGAEARERNLPRETDPQQDT